MIGTFTLCYLLSQWFIIALIPFTMKAKILSFSGLFLALFFLSHAVMAQTPIKLGSAIDFGVLAGGDVKANIPAYAYYLYGGLASTSPNISGPDAASNSKIQTALQDLANAKKDGYALGGKTTGADLAGLVFSDGNYEVKGDAYVKEGGIITLKGDSKSFIVFNVHGGLSFLNDAQVVLIGVRPEHVYWNIEDDVTFAPSADASGLFLAGGSITTDNRQFGMRQLLAEKDILLTDLGHSFGTSTFYSASKLAGGLSLGCNPTVPAACDNQIINASFEDYNPCPISYDNVTDACSFLNYGGGTADYFNACAPVINGASSMNVPANFLTVANQRRTAHTGNAYAGATSAPAGAAYSYSYREYFTQRLPSQLQAGEQYYGEFWVSLAPTARYSMRELGMQVSANPLQVPTPSPAPIVLTPTISGSPGTPAAVGTQWVRINGVFTASGTERFVTLGCFLPDIDPLTGTNTFAAGPGPGWGHPGAYYFYDDLGLYRLPSAGLPQTITCRAVTIGQACTLPTALGPVTYQWAPTTGLSSPNQPVTQAAPSVTTTYTLTTTIGGRSIQSSVTVTVNNIVPASAVQLGNGPGTLRTYTGGMTLSGNYAASGDLLLTNGTYTMTPGTTVYFNDAPVGGQPVGKIIVGPNATLNLDNATIRGGCNSWFGIVLSQNYPNTHLRIENSSVIKNAKYGVFADRWDYSTVPTYDTQYTITDSQFENNWTHVYDESSHQTPASSCSIVGCSFTSNAQQMLPPYYSAVPGSFSDQITYQALFINPYTYGNVFPNPLTIANSGRVNVAGNAVTTAVYGILNNYQDRGFVNINDNVLTNIYATAIWKAANPGYSVDFNTIALNGSRSVNTSQISPNNPVIGIDAGSFSISGGSVQVSYNGITGDNAQNQTNYKEQIGIVAPYEEVAVLGNALSTLSTGATYSLPNFNLFSNRFTNCLTGVKVVPYDQSYGNYLGNFQRLECNTFERTSGFTATTYGIWAPPRIPSGGVNMPARDAYLPDLGTLARPCGNAFANIGVSVQNEGNNPSPTYYRFNTAQETVLTSATLFVSTGAVPRTNECQLRGGTIFPPNGVNRQSNSLAYVTGLMDSVRLQQVPLQRQGAYQQQIIDYFAKQGNLPGLEQYAATLPGTNREAVYAFNRYLMRACYAKHQSKAAQRARQQLLTLAVSNDDVRQEVALLDLLVRADRWPAAGHRLPAADSAGLASVATSGATVAEQAATWLRYYYPHAAPYREPRQQAAPLMASSSVPAPRAQLAETELYPNPAATTATARYRVAKAGRIELQVFSLLTSRQVLAEQLPAAKAANDYQEHLIDLRTLPAGQYSYRFVVDGKPQAPHHFIVQ
jgi:hypothetical protein